MLLTEERRKSSSFDFEAIASRYDAWYKTARGAMYDRLEKQAFDQLLASENSGKNLIEVGCGTGHWSNYFSAKGFEVTGVDISEEMIQIARTKSIAHCRFLVADGENLPFADNSFDAAATVTTLEFTTDPKRMIAEVVRCVKTPGGRLFIGALNVLSRYNQKRKEKSGSVYTWARLFTPRQLSDLLKAFGTVKILIVGFVPRKNRLIGLAPLWESICHFAHSKQGAFIVAEVQL